MAGKALQLSSSELDTLARKTSCPRDRAQWLHKRFATLQTPVRGKLPGTVSSADVAAGLARGSDQRAAQACLESGLFKLKKGKCSLEAFVEGCSSLDAATRSLEERLGILFVALVALGNGNSRATTIGSPAAMGTLLGKLGMDASGDEAAAAFNEANGGKPVDKAAFVGFMQRQGLPSDAASLQLPPARSATAGAYNVEFQEGSIGLQLLPLHLFGGHPPNPGAGETGVVVDGVVPGGQAGNAGLIKRGDILLAVSGEAISAMHIDEAMQVLQRVERPVRHELRARWGWLVGWVMRVDLCVRLRENQTARRIGTSSERPGAIIYIRLETVRWLAWVVIRGESKQRQRGRWPCGYYPNTEA